MSLTEGTALLFGSEWVLNLPSAPHHPTQPPATHPPPIDSTRDIIGTEKLSQKPAAFK